MWFVVIAEKSYRSDDEVSDLYSNAVNTARDYYNSSDADNFYAIIWGGEDLHIGLYADETEDIGAASRRTVETMAELGEITAKTRVLDLGAGYGGSARYLAATYGCHVTCLNLSEVENERNRRMNEEQGLADLIEVIDGSFEDLSFHDNAFDLVWAQDTFLHSGDRTRALEEAVRVLRPGGELIITDPMATEGASEEDLKPILERIQLDTLAIPEYYRRELYRLGANSVEFYDHSEHIARHYQRVFEELTRREAELDGYVSEEFRERMKTGVQHWMRCGRSGSMAWGIFHVRM